MTTTRRRSATTATALSLAVACLGAVAACGGERTVTAPDRPATSSPTTTTTPATSTPATSPASPEPGPPEPAPATTTSAPPTGTPGPTTAPTGPANGACAATAASVAASLDPGSAGAGHYTLRLTVTNKGTSSCTLRGYPGVSVVDAGGWQLGRAADRAPGDTPTITVRPGGSASTLVRVTQAGNYPTCTTANGAGLRVYLPGERAALVAPYDAIVACSDATTPTLLVVAAFR